MWGVGCGVGCGVFGVGCGVWGLGCGVWGVGCGAGVWGFSQLFKSSSAHSRFAPYLCLPPNPSPPLLPSPYRDDRNMFPSYAFFHGSETCSLVALFSRLRNAFPPPRFRDHVVMRI